MVVALYLPSDADRLAAQETLRRVRSTARAYVSQPLMLAALREGGVPHAVVTALRDEFGCSTEPLISRLRASHPMLPIVAYGVLSPSLASDIVAGARAGLTDASLHGCGDLAAVLQRIVRVPGAISGTDVATVALSAVRARLSPSTLPIMSYCLTNAHAAPAVERMATELGVRRQTIAARLAAAFLPTASALVSWGRLLLASRLLEDARRPVERVAHALAFDSGTALRHMLMRYTGLRTAEVRARGGFAEVLPLFIAAVGGVPLASSLVAVRGLSKNMT